MADWQDISTAPKAKKHVADGLRAELVLLTDGDGVYIGFWNGRAWDDGDYNSNMGQMTHWMPLPELPHG